MMEDETRHLFSRLGRGIGQHPGIAVLARNRGDVHLGKKPWNRWEEALQRAIGNAEEMAGKWNVNGWKRYESKCHLYKI